MEKIILRDFISQDTQSLIPSDTGLAPVFSTGRLLANSSTTWLAQGRRALPYLCITLAFGHVDLSATQIDTHVSIRKLQEIHAPTHPVKLQDKPAFLTALLGDIRLGHPLGLPQAASSIFGYAAAESN